LHFDLRISLKFGDSQVLPNHQTEVDYNACVFWARFSGVVRKDPGRSVWSPQGREPATPRVNVVGVLTQVDIGIERGRTCNSNGNQAEETRRQGPGKKEKPKKRHARGIRT
jgi:hypothetical protein